MQSEFGKKMYNLHRFRLLREGMLLLNMHEIIATYNQSMEALQIHVNFVSEAYTIITYLYLAQSLSTVYQI